MFYHLRMPDRITSMNEGFPLVGLTSWGYLGEWVEE